MSIEVDAELIDKFLVRLMEIEEKYAFTKKGQESSRKEEIRELLENVCKG